MKSSRALQLLLISGAIWLRDVAFILVNVSIFVAIVSSAGSQQKTPAVPDPVRLFVKTVSCWAALLVGTGLVFLLLLVWQGGQEAESANALADWIPFILDYYPYRLSFDSTSIRLMESGGRSLGMLIWLQMNASMFLSTAFVALAWSFLVKGARTFSGAESAEIRKITTSLTLLNSLILIAVTYQLLKFLYLDSEVTDYFYFSGYFGSDRAALTFRSLLIFPAFSLFIFTLSVAVLNFVQQRMKG